MLLYSYGYEKFGLMYIIYSRSLRVTQYDNYTPLDAAFLFQIFRVFVYVLMCFSHTLIVKK